MNRIKVRKNFRELKQYKHKTHRPLKGNGSYTRKKCKSKLKSYVSGNVKSSD